MSYIIVFVIGVVVGIVAMRFLDSRFRGNDKLVNPAQSEHRKQNLEKVLAIAREKGEIRNDDIQYALGVSDATATRYLEDLEQQGKLIQSGTGKGTIYRAN